MCKHVLNAQVAIRSACCRKWFDCAECHQESADHELLKRDEMIFACKKCKKCFRKDANEFEDADEYCPHCDNHFVIDAVTPKARLEVEGEDVRIDARMIKDERVKQEELRTIFDVKDAANRLG
ncbi:HOT13-Zinc-binding mitochondrial intermembrane space protein [Venturia nashicola]|uniref:HOT13-Zinc-binding mitochondrial intermembrane space protein n=1 Tax=Venturia nashicola TaxID=86259 RepID=A0A4Z1PCR2_9PEZI|nr:HOT13-Zinc-binding mitochondrial intermembrane space protein [Venturia nashicola]TLD35631.1 HOT13-Zinc-binding mitochondrial intermembrane space protein [Venturia nashicola]